MIKMLLISGLAATIATGAALAQTAPAPPPPAGDAQAHGQGPGGHGAGMGRGMRGQGMHGQGMRGQGTRGPGGGRGPGGDGQRPTLEQMQQRTAQMFAQLDVNKDGRATQAEFQAMMERRRVERQQEAFQRFSGGADSVTLDQLNARMAERFSQRQGGRGGEGRGR